MAAALNFLLIGLLLPGALCRGFRIRIPESIKALRGSCVTIPCSFDVDDNYGADLNNTCKAMWKTKINNEVVFDSSEHAATNGELRGNLIEKDCTTNLNNLPHDDGNEYHFRLQCPNKLKWDYKINAVKILVQDDALRPNLTASALQVKEGTSVMLTCSAPAPCLSHPPTLSWTPSLGHSHETLLEKEDKTQDMISVLNFTASHLHHRQEISCTAVYNKLDNSMESAMSEVLTIDITLTGLEQYLGPHGVPLLAVAAVSLCVNILCTIYVVFLKKARKSMKPKEEEDRTYMSLELRDMSPDYDVIGQTPK